MLTHPRWRYYSVYLGLTCETDICDEVFILCIGHRGLPYVFSNASRICMHVHILRKYMPHPQFNAIPSLTTPTQQFAPCLSRIRHPYPVPNPSLPTLITDRLNQTDLSASLEDSVSSLFSSALCVAIFFRAFAASLLPRKIACHRRWSISS